MDARLLPMPARLFAGSRRRYRVILMHVFMDVLHPAIWTQGRG